MSFSTGNKITRAVPDLQIGDEKLIAISDAIKKTYSENEQSESAFFKKLRILSSFESMLQDRGINDMLYKYGARFHRVIPFGSSVTDLATKTGDFDMCISIELHEKGNKHDKLYPARVLRWVKEQFDSNFPFPKPCNIKFIPEADVPIIRILCDTNEVNGEKMEFDISASVGPNPPYSMKSVQLFNAYSQLDFRFFYLCIFIKKWFKSVSSGRKTFVPNSYATTLLVIHFLQYYGILPVLQATHPERFDPKNLTWDECIRWKVESYPLSKRIIDSWLKEKKVNSTISLGALFVAFLNYYTNIVSLKNKIIVAEDGTVKEKRNVEGDLKLRIHDCYDLNNPGRRMSDVSSFEESLRKGFDLIMECERSEELVDKLFKDVKINFYNARRNSKKMSRAEKAKRRMELSWTMEPYIPQRYDSDWNPIDAKPDDETTSDDWAGYESEVSKYLDRVNNYQSENDDSW